MLVYYNTVYVCIIRCCKHIINVYIVRMNVCMLYTIHTNNAFKPIIHVYIYLII